MRRPGDAQPVVGAGPDGAAEVHQPGFLGQEFVHGSDRLQLADGLPDFACGRVAVAHHPLRPEAGVGPGQTVLQPDRGPAHIPVLTALAVMTQRRVRHLPVTEDGKLKGIVSIGDLVKHRMERIEAEAEAMRAYIQSA